MLIRALGALSVAALCAASLVQILRPSVPRLLYNPSPSAPIGWYRLRPDAVIARGDLVAALAPKEGASIAIERQYLPPNIPLIKTVWAVHGEVICHQDGQVFVRGRPALILREHDALGRALPSREGCYALSKDEVFLVSTDVQTSFDSRYFGPVDLENVLGSVKYLGQFKSRSERRKGWARVKGAEGKIKGGGVTPRLTPCLHIGFGNSPPKGRELPIWCKPPWGLSFWGCHLVFYPRIISED